ncbi:hypothetical protein I8752_07775 [Nostocaceae cyanobacterium CENA369]|uniref:Uncharacterized protein n=1 Tax=Dendronalium phyllosphericum CENA369 TaxID=1725256 RepID=A0A8J7I4N7_9NOST|nr:hypothetical protein [Dendronalium phyllosphericum]MBH8572916.1 hypothetical protein [Dendronalium phyllosphericum CENA369]
MTNVQVLIFYYRIQQALQWWHYRQSIKLFLEAEKIRDELLQEIFTIRCNLYLLKLENMSISSDKTQKYLDKIDNLHHSLVQLSDRLFPPFLQDSLPLAIQCLLERWLVSNPHIHFQSDMPLDWRYEPLERGLIVLMSLEELLTIILSEILASVSIYFSLKQKENVGELKVQINYPDVSTFVFNSHIPEFKHLCETFRFLTSGKCLYRTQELRVTWYFIW